MKMKHLVAMRQDVDDLGAARIVSIGKCDRAIGCKNKAIVYLYAYADRHEKRTRFVVVGNPDHTITIL